ncbi:30S ribosomal protein S2 [Patescibacteria group bacterium]|nr:30S ribosomal protein S2 [Patescibacteria group bacterium]
MSNVTLEQMLEAGVHFGHQTFRWNPKMKPFIFDDRDGVHIIDLTKTERKLKEALGFVAKIAKQEELLLLVSTKRQAGDIIRNLAKETNLPYVSDHWPGGLLTNFSTMKSRINYLKQLREKVATGSFGDMTKKEIGLLEKELAKLEKSFGGLDNLNKLPGAIFVVDVIRERIAVKEAIKLGIPVIAMVDTNADPTDIDYVIPSNDDAKNGIILISHAIADTFVKNYKLSQDDKSVSEKVEGEDGAPLISDDETEVVEKEVEAKAKPKKKIVKKIIKEE